MRELPAQAQLLVLFLAMGLADKAGAQAPSVSLHGSNTLRGEYYENKGPNDKSPFANERDHWYDELSLDFVRRASPYETMRAQFAGLYNKSDYRSEFRDVVPERGNFVWEKGDWYLPFRLEGGDFLSNVSYRTQYRTLKGAQLELQPEVDWLGAEHSLLFFLGADHPSWRRFHGRKDWSAGASWLVEDSWLGNFSLNEVSNSFMVGGARDENHRRQTILSLAWERLFEFWEQKVTLEAEAARFHGEPTTDETPGKRDDKGVLLQAQWDTSSPLSLRGRYERYGEYFQPRGGVVTPNRKSYEGEASWRFDSGLQFRARCQRYIDAFQGAVSTNTDVWGFTLVGPMLTHWVESLTGNVSGFFRDTDTSDSTTSTQTLNLQASVSKPVIWGWNVSPSVFLQRDEDETQGGDTTRTIQGGLALDHAIAFAGWQGSCSVGLVARRVRDGDSDTEDYYPTASAHLVREAHSLDLEAGFQTQHRRDVGGIDSDTYSCAGRYAYTWGNNVFGVEAQYQSQQDSPGADVQSFMGALYWTYNFDYRSHRQRAAEHGPALRVPAMAPRQRRPSLAALAALAPGMSLQDALNAARQWGLQRPTMLPTAAVFDTILMGDIRQRQRVALTFGPDKKITKAAVIIDVADVGEPETVRQLFERVRSKLVREFGRPVVFYEDGEFTPALPVDVNMGRFVRINEWETAGGVLRFGIPRRLDGRVRMEIQHARRFPPLKQTLWSVTEVR